MCLLPSDGDEKEYLVPSMLMSPPNDAANKLLSDSFITSLFVRFKRPSRKEYVQVPLGLFQRLVVKSLELCTQEKYKDMYQNFARFPIHPRGHSVIYCCHSSSIQTVVYRDPNTPAIDESVEDIGDKVLLQLDTMLKSLRKECCWLNTMEYEFSVICPVCCEQRPGKCCSKSCKEEESLHFWSESNLQNEEDRFCRENTTAAQETVLVEQFTPWFKSLRKHVSLVHKKIIFKTIRLSPFLIVNKFCLLVH